MTDSREDTCRGQGRAALDAVGPEARCPRQSPGSHCETLPPRGEGLCTMPQQGVPGVAGPDEAVSARRDLHLCPAHS